MPMLRALSATSAPTATTADRGSTCRPAAAATAALAAHAALAAAAAAFVTPDPASHALLGPVQQALVGTRRPVCQEQVLPRWRGRCQWSQLRVRHGLHGLRGTLQVAAAVVAAVGAAVVAAVVAAAAFAAAPASTVGHGVEVACGARCRLQELPPPLRRRDGGGGRLGL